MRKFLLLVLLAALVVVPVMAQEEGEPPRTGLRPDAPPYAIRGPHPVGTMDMVIDEDGERPLPVTVWYPALNSENAEESVTYQPLIKWLPWPEGDYGVFGRALRNAEPDDSGAPYPLIVFSHGYSAFPASYAVLLEHLASHGFVVLAPDHSERYYFDVDSWADSWQDVPKVMIERPHDISQVLDYATTWTSDEGAFEGIIDMEHVAVTGQSIGGYTTLATAGARYDLETYNAVCARSSDDPVFWGLLCDVIVPHETEMAQLAGLDPMPDGLWPSMSDPRVDAIVPMAGDAYLFGQAGLAEITIPMLALGGTLDGSTPYDWGARLAYDHVSSAQKALVSFEGSDHFIFMSRCDDNPWLPEMGSFFMCSDPVWDMDRAHDLINHFTTAFLLAELYGDEEARAALAPDAVAFPGIGYEAVGY